MPDTMKIAQALYRKFYSEFKCLECGNCCTLSKGGVLLQGKDIDRICNKLNISRRKFKDTYTEVGKDKKRRIHQPCPFRIEGKGCTVHTTRPEMCHDYPVRGWNPTNLQLVVDGNCPGVQKILAEGALKDVLTKPNAKETNNVK